MRALATLLPAAALLAAAALPLPAETLRLTLPQAVELGLANAGSVQSKALGIEQARQEVTSARSGYHPSANVSAGWSHQFQKPGGLTIPGLGTTYSIPQDPVSLSLQLSQPIYTFGKLRTGLALAEAGVQSAQLALDQEKWTLAGRIERAFYGFLLAREALDVQRQTLAAKQETLEVARRKYQVGAASDYEVLQAEADLEAFRPALIGAENGVALSLLTVKNLLGLPSEQAMEVELVGSLAPEPAPPLELRALIERARAERYEARSLRQGQQAAALQERLARQSFYPSIGGLLGYRLSSGVDPLTGANRYWGEDSWDGSLSGGLSVSVPLSVWLPGSAQQAEVQKARLRQRELALSLKALEGQLELQVQQALLAIQEQQLKLRSGEKNIALAQRLYDSAREQYAHGVISSLELQNAQLGLNAARLAQLQSQHDFRLALLDLRDAVGAPLGTGTRSAAVPSSQPRAPSSVPAASPAISPPARAAQAD